jgi:perosamine synthetase
LTVSDAPNGRNARRLRWMGNWPFENKRECYWQPAMGNIVEPVPGKWPHNFCMGEPNCAVGRLLLKRVDAINRQRQRQAERFQRALADCPELSFQKVPEGFSHVYHLMSARFDGPNGKNRNDLIQLLTEKYNLDTVVQYWPLYRTELFRSFGFEQANVPETDRFFDNMISFPWWSDMPDQTIDDMADRVRTAIGELRK